MEKSLIVELQRDCAWKRRLRAANSSSVLSAFGEVVDLVAALHDRADSADTSRGDRLLVEILEEHARAEAGSIWQLVLLLVFVPTIHATVSRVALRFPSLGSEDIAQYVIVEFLEFLVSKELAACRSHIAYSVARRLRRRAYRWAIHEARLRVPDETAEKSSEEFQEQELLDADVLLARFLDHCQAAGWLLQQERELLVEHKLGKVSCQQLARRNGHSAVAIRSRLQRLVEKLRRVAEKSPPRQLELFPAVLGEKYFDGTR